MKHGLILSGGFILGAYEATVAGAILRHYENTDSPVTVISGTSVGALNAAVLVQNANAGADIASRALERIWEGLRPGDIYRAPSFGRLGLALRVLRDQPALDVTPLRRLIAQHINIEALRRSPTRLLVHATELTWRRQVTARNDSPNLAEMILASASVPGLFPHVSLGGLTLVDGGVTANTPIKQAILEDCELLTIIYLENEAIREPVLIEKALEDGAANVPGARTVQWALSRTLETAMAQQLERDVHFLSLYNALVPQTPKSHHTLRHISKQIVQPSYPLAGPSEAMNDDPAFIRELMRRGRQDGRRFVENFAI